MKPTYSPELEAAAERGLSAQLPDIECFPNKQSRAFYVHRMEALEYTSMCPKTGHPDTGVIEIEYAPGDSCAELKSMKEYLHAFRNLGIFYENLVNVIADDFFQDVRPVWVRVTARMMGRGGVRSTLVTERASSDLAEEARKLALIR
jgi:7-cyano-7-deazaguanine reductase